MRIAMIGSGYVGLVTGACFADSGNEVTCVDIDEAKVAMLKSGRSPIYEPGLSELLLKNGEAGRLRFTTQMDQAVASARLVFLAVGTPSAVDGSADLTALHAAVAAAAPSLASDAVVVVKSTVPVGTNAAIDEQLFNLLGRRCSVASNPEFLKEGAAIDDFTKPDRVVVGVRDDRAADLIHELYRPFLRTEHPFLVMSPESAEMTKYAANAMLATKISFINELANLCDRLAADVNDVRRGMGHDARIGFSFLFPGAGYGGSCFPKDVRALAHLAEANGVAPRMLTAIDAVNEHQKHVLADKIQQRFGEDLAGKKIAVWGLAFKPRTDDIREAPSLVLIERMLAAGAEVVVHDPEAVRNVHAIFGDRIAYADAPLEALDGADALALVTEWPEYRQPNVDEMVRRMRGRHVFDGRNILPARQLMDAGFEYEGIGLHGARVSESAK